MNRIISLVASLMFTLSICSETKLTTVTFDFTDLTSLTPKIEWPEGSPGVEVVNDVFTAGLCTMSFSYENTITPLIFKNDNQTELWMYRGNFMHLSVGDKAELKSIQFSGNTSTFDQYQSQGTIDFTHDLWTNTDKDGKSIDGIHDVTFRWYTQKQGCVTKVMVTYSSAPDVLDVKNFSIADNAKVTSFKDIDLTFASDIANVDNTKKATITLEGGATQNMSVSYTGNVATLSVADKLEWDGDDEKYTINIPAGLFIDADGNYNKAYTVSFTIVAPLNTLTLMSVYPTTGIVTEIPNVINLQMSDNVGWINHSVECEVRDQNGVKHGYGLLSRVPGTPCVDLTLANDHVITDAGVYTITIPEKSICDVNYVENKTLEEAECKYNPEIKLVYNVGDVQYPSDAVYAAAQKLLEYSGVGYPSETSAVRTTLAGLVETKHGSDATFRTAMKAFRAEATAISLPETGKLYRIASVTKDGSKTYLTYQNGKVTLSTDASKACKFTATKNADNTVSFKTADGMYLHTLTNTNLYYGTSKDNVCAYNAKVNNLTIARFDSTKVAGLTANDVFGKVTLYGCLGAKDGSDKNAYSLVAYGEIDLDVTGAVYLDNNTTSAFSITEVEKDAPVITVTVTPADKSSVATLSSMTLSFAGDGVTAVQLADESKISLKNASGTSITFSVIKIDDLNYKVSFGSVAPGAYTLTVGDGAFTQKFNNKTYDLEGFTNTVTATVGDDFVYDFQNITDMITNQSFPTTGSSITKFNDFNFHFIKDREYVEPFVVSGNEVYLTDPWEYRVAKGTLVKRTEQLEETYRGVFDKNDNFIGEVEYENLQGDAVTLINHKVYYLQSGDYVKDCIRYTPAYYLDLKLDKVMTEDDAEDGIYQLHLLKATFGDSNYGIYLSDPSLVSKSDCHVNTGMILPYHIIKGATGIRDVETTTTADSAVYDIAGRRVNNTSKPGLYIIGGKKVMVK